MAAKIDNQSNKPRLLAVLAHPDDETFGMGGTIAYYARRGVDTYLICATRGEAGEVDDTYLEGFSSIAERRECELRCAAKILDLTEVFMLNYRDSGMPGSADNQHPQALAAQPTEVIAAEIAGYIRSLKPQVLVTFDPIGGYRHPDHIAIHQATVKAFELAGDPDYKDKNGLPAYTPLKFYFQTVPHGFLRLIVKIMRLLGRDPHKFGRNGDIDLAAIADVRFPTDAVINYRQVADIREQASRCHESQGGGSLTGGLFGPLRRWISSKEIYMRAYPLPVMYVENDLFEKITHLPKLRRGKFASEK